MSENRLLLGFDIGTSGLKSGVFDTNGHCLFSNTFSYETAVYSGNRVEQDANDWWTAFCKATNDILDHHPEWINKIAVISLTGQMMGCLPVDHRGNPLRPSIIWSDQRASKEACSLSEVIGDEELYIRTGQIAAPSFTAAKILWLKNNEKEIYSRTYKVLNSKDFIASRLTGEFYTDPCDASGTNLYHLENGEWDQDILHKMEINENILPTIAPSSKVIGTVTKKASELTGILEGTPVVIGGGDGSVAALGAGMVKEGDAYISLGTSAWLSVVTASPVYDSKLRTTTEAHVVPGLFCPNGTTYNGSEPFKWLKQNIFSSQQEKMSYEELTELANFSPPGANRLLFIPYLQGEKCPYPDPNARGAFIGLASNHTKADMARAVLEGCALNLRVIYDFFLDQGISISSLRMVGGGAANSLWLSIFADVFNVKIEVPQAQDSSTALGAAILGGVGIGLYPDFSIAAQLVQIDQVVFPNYENSKLYKKKLKLFKLAYYQLQPLFNKLSEIHSEEMED